MVAFARAGIVAALVALLSLMLSTGAFAQKAFQRDDLAEAAIKLEAQIKTEAGAVTKPVAQLKREADAAFALLKKLSDNGFAQAGQIGAKASASVSGSEQQGHRTMAMEYLPRPVSAPATKAGPRSEQSHPSATIHHFSCGPVEF